MNRRGLNIVIWGILLRGFIALPVAAQLQFHGNNAQWYQQVTNYNTRTQINGITLIMEDTGTKNAINMPNWRITARVISQTPASNGKYFPIDKVSIQPNFTTGIAHPPPVPSVGQIGFYPNVTLSTVEQDLVTSSLVPLVHDAPGQHYRWEYWFDWTIEGGAYMTELQEWQNYYFSIEYKLFSGTGQLMGSFVLPHYIQVGKLSGTPPVQNNFSLTVNGGARNGTLTLQSRSDYDSGTSVTYTNGLTINTNAAYQVTVNASAGTPYFTYENNSIDLDVLKVQLSTSATGVTELNPVILSTSAQRVAKGSSTGNQNITFDVNYSINPAQKDKLLYAYKDKQQSETTYTTTLQYTILAQ